MSSDLQTRLTEAEKCFKKACEQIVHLNRRLDDMAKRYDKASRENHRSFRYSLRLRMAVSEGVRNMYYEYAANKADEITNLRCQVLHQGSGSRPTNGNPAATNGQAEEEEAEEDSNAVADFDVGELMNGASVSTLQENGDDDNSSEMQEVDHDDESNDTELGDSVSLNTNDIEEDSVMEEVEEPVMSVDAPSQGVLTSAGSR